MYFLEHSWKGLVEALQISSQSNEMNMLLNKFSINKKKKEKRREISTGPMIVIIAKDRDMGGIRHWHGVHCEAK